MIVPSVDLMGGKVVQLERGSKKKLEETDVEARVAEFARYGEVALIDLDAAMGQGDNVALVERIVRKYPCRVGGGVRDVERAKRLYALGAERVIIGSAAFRDGAPDVEFVSAVADAIGRESLIVSIDSLGGKVAVSGWKKTLPLGAPEAARALAPYCGGFLATCVDKEGMMGGTDENALDAIRAALGPEAGRIRITAAGGISSVEEIAGLSRKGYDLQLGMAIYTGAVPVAEAFIASIDFSAGPVPTAVRDQAGQILMVSSSTEESLRETFRAGFAVYAPGKRGAARAMPACPPSPQRLVSVRTDCLSLSLLFTVESSGPSCGTESWSCYGPRDFSLEELYAVIKDRFDHPREGSYTSTLDADRIRRKINEEAFELIDAETDEELVWEAGDLLYFMTAYLARKGVSLKSVWNELRKRRRK
jgi:phosphoribosyl-AMP cyclohydrolase / phosphoribosyl-ATP pyrophosphohydrolase